MHTNHIVLKSLLIASAWIAVHAVSLPSLSDRELPPFPNKCPHFEGTFVIDQYKLYPENADFDFRTCLLYIGDLFNATVGVHDPYKGEIVDILYFPGISLNSDYHIGGVGVDQVSGLLSIVADAADAFDTSGANISGTNWILQWDPKSRKVLYKLNLTEAVDGKYGGYQDVEQDPEGNVFVVGTYPSSILKVDKHGKTITPWYLSPPPINQTIAGLCGLAAKGWLLLGNDNTHDQLLKFDMRDKIGIPVIVPHYPNVDISITDAIYFPPKYEGTVLLVSQDIAGIAVLRSKDGKWDWAEYLGLVPNLLNGTFAVAPVQVGDGLYIVSVPFDPIVPGTTSGNRTLFPFVDITKEVEKLLFV